MEPEVRRRFERIEAILEDVSRRQAEAEARFEKHEARFERHEARFDKLEARFEKRMRGFEKLVGIGMKEMRRVQRQTDDRINALIESQQRTETSLQRLIDSLGKSPNGGRRTG